MNSLCNTVFVIIMQIKLVVVVVVVVVVDSSVTFFFQPLDSVAELLLWQVLQLVIFSYENRLTEGAYFVLIFSISAFLFVCFVFSV